MGFVEKTPAVVERAGALRNSPANQHWLLRIPQVIIPGNAGILEEGRVIVVQRGEEASAQLNFAENLALDGIDWRGDAYQCLVLVARRRLIACTTTRDHR